MSARILIWTAAVDASAETRWESLDASERARASRFAFERDRRQFVAAHALKRLMLAHVCGTDPAALAFVTDEGGKPAVAGGAGPHFNISHCEGLVACAVSQDVAVGVDVEPIGRAVSPELIRAALSPAEAAWLAQRDAAEQALSFFRLWTLKEAFIKATGRGLAQNLQSFSMAVDPLGVSFADPSLGRARDWHLTHDVVGGAHLLSCAACIGAGAAEVTLSHRGQ